MMNDLHNSINPVRVLSPAAAVTDNTAQAGQFVDHANYGSAEYVILTGSLADADATFTVSMTEGDDTASMTAVDDNDLIGLESEASFTFEDDNSQFKLGYRGSKRYTQLTITPANNSGNAFLAAVCILGNPKKAPV